MNERVAIKRSEIIIGYRFSPIIENYLDGKNFALFLPMWGRHCFLGRGDLRMQAIYAKRDLLKSFLLHHRRLHRGKKKTSVANPPWNEKNFFHVIFFNSRSSIRLLF